MSVQYHDLSVAPFRPSRVLSAFVTDIQAKRRHETAQREQAAQQAAFRRIGGGASGQPRRKALDAMLAGLPQPAFAQINGERAFSAAGTDRLLSNWLAVNTGINADLEAALAALRARSRDWVMNTDMGERYLTLAADNIVGSEPPRLQVRALLADNKTPDDIANTAVEMAFADWCRRGKCEITGEMSFVEVLRSVVETTARDGEYLVNQMRNAGLPFGYALQMLDVDRIDTTRNVAASGRGDNGIRLGIELDRLGRKQAVYLHAWHPGDSGAGIAPAGSSGRVPAEQLLHGFVRRRPEQVRGYPWCAPVLRGAAELQQYKAYAMVAARVGAAKMGFYTTDKDVLSDGMTLDELKDATGNLVQDVEAGMLEALPPGVKFESFDPDYPHQNYSAFFDHGQRDLSAGLNVAHHNLTGNMTGVNYSSARIAELAERRHWRALQRWLISSFVRPVFDSWLRSALITGSIRLPSGAALPADRFDKFSSAASFQPPGWAWVDPEADIKASATAMTYDLRSLRQISDEQGVDMDDVLHDKAALRDKYIAAGLTVPAWMDGGKAMTVSGTPTPAPAPAAETTAAPAAAP